MPLDGLFGDGELLGNVLIGAALNNAGDDLELARGEAEGLLFGDGGCLGHQSMKSGEEICDALAADPIIAREHGAEGLAQIPGHGVLKDNATSADLQCFNNLLRGDGAGQQNDLDPWRLGHDRAHGFEPRQPRHIQVQKQDVRFELEGLGNGLIAILSFTYDLKTGFGLEHVFDTESNDGVIVGDNDADVGTLGEASRL